MIQDIAPHIYNNKYVPCMPEADDFILVYDGRNLYATEAMREAGVEYYSIGR